MDLGPPHIDICPVTVGRRAELARIFQRLLGQSPGVMLISGEAGIGKSRLAREAMREAVRLGHRVVRGDCFESDAGLPFAPLREILRSLAADTSAAEIAQIAGPYATSLSKLLPEFISTVEAAAPMSEPDQEKRNLFEALDRILASIATASPLLVVVEDLHWSDAASLEFLLFLAHRSTGRQLSTLVTYRDDEVGPDLAHFLAGLDRERLAVEVSLAGLDAGSVDAMLRAIYGLSRAAPADLIHLLATLTDGNPFFIEEVLTSLHISGASLSVDGSWTGSNTDALRVPRSVQDAVRRRSTRLSPAAKRVLELAAVTGRSFRFSLLQSLARVEENDLVASLKELIGAQLIVEESAERFAFRHALTRQAVYADLLTRERQRLHQEVADTLERSPDADDPPLSDLAYHYFAAASWEKAATYARRAGDHAIALWTPRAAVEHYRRALEAARHLPMPLDPDLVRARGAAYEVLGEFNHAQADYEAACDVARSAGQSDQEVAALLSLGLLWAANDYSRSGIAIQNALTVAREIGDASLVARCLNRLGNWHFNTESPADGQRCHQEALAIFEALGDWQGVAETLDLLGVAAVFTGDLMGVTSAFRRAVDIWRKLGDRRGLASSLILLAMHAPTYHTDSVPAVSSHAEVQADVEEGLTISRAIGWRTGESWALWIMGGMTLAPQGAYRRAFDALEQARLIAEEISHRQWLAAIDCTMGHAFVDLLDYDQARQHLERALTGARAMESRYWQRSAVAWLASTAVSQGDHDSAQAVLDEEFTPQLSMETVATRLLWRAAAEHALARGEPDRALHIIDRLIASAPQTATSRPIVRLEKLRGESLMVMNQSQAAEIALRRARDTADELGTRPMLWRSHLALGQLYRSAGREDEALHAFDATRAVIDDLANEIPNDAQRNHFLKATAALLPTQSNRLIHQSSRATPGHLTVREWEVARLVAQGMSNREIAADLFISEWTAATHVRNILAKLKLTSRTQIAAWVVEHR